MPDCTERGFQHWGVAQSTDLKPRLSREHVGLRRTRLGVIGVSGLSEGAAPPPRHALWMSMNSSVRGHQWVAPVVVFG
jgi:hypothetical protein